MFEKRKLIKLARKNGWTVEQYNYIDHYRVKVFEGDSILYDISETEYMNPYYKILWFIRRDMGPEVKVVYSPK